MIEKLEVRNFKSIKDLTLNCKRVNIFIGEPNTGKSNVLEALGVLSGLAYGPNSLHSFVRMESPLDWFYNKNLADKIRIIVDNENLEIEFKDGYFVYSGFEIQKNPFTKGSFRADGEWAGGQYAERLQKIKFYRFSLMRMFDNERADFLFPPWETTFWSFS